MTNTKKNTERREDQEIALRESGYSIESFSSYIEFEKTKLDNQHGFVRGLYERAIALTPLVPELWVRYIEYTVCKRG